MCDVIYEWPLKVPKSKTESLNEKQVVFDLNFFVFCVQDCRDIIKNNCEIAKSNVTKGFPETEVKKKCVWDTPMVCYYREDIWSSKPDTQSKTLC